MFDRAEVPVLTAPEVADELDCSRPSAYNKLEELVEQGKLHKKTVGARGRVHPDGRLVHHSIRPAAVYGKLTRKNFPIWAGSIAISGLSGGGIFRLSRAAGARRGLSERETSRINGWLSTVVR